MMYFTGWDQIVKTVCPQRPQIPIPVEFMMVSGRDDAREGTDILELSTSE